MLSSAEHEKSYITSGPESFFIIFLIVKSENKFSDTNKKKNLNLSRYNFLFKLYCGSETHFLLIALNFHMILDCTYQPGPSCSKHR